MKEILQSLTIGETIVADVPTDGLATTLNAAVQNKLDQSLAP